jgi:DNA-binding FadR family transcriptional regulator
MDKDSLANKVVREILGRIFSGEYAAHSRLPSERALSEEFQISRGTVRDALGSLAELGVIAVRHGSGAYVQSPSQFGIPAIYLPPEIAKISLEDILCVRKAIEGVAAEVAASRIAIPEVERLEQLLAQAEQELDDLPAFLRHDLAFHEAIVRASGNSALLTAFESIREYLRYFQVFTSRGEDDERQAIEQHRQIVTALRRRDPKAAARAVRKHLEAIGHSSTAEKKKRKSNELI